MFDPARKREAYLPRTNPLGKSERLYSRRSSLPFDRLPFFIQLPFRPRCTPGAEHTSSICLFRVGDHRSRPRQSKRIPCPVLLYLPNTRSSA